MAEASCFDFERSGGERLVPAESEDDALVAQALNELTMEEREKVYEELHGVNEIAEESPEFIAERIKAIRAELGRFPISKRRTFDRAVFLKPALEHDEKLYLLFLRAERFDEVAAAKKLCLHFDHKLELFGEVKLPKKITLDDMDEDDMACFYAGSYVILPKKDRAGRSVGLINLPRIKFRDWKNQVRYTWYNIFSVLLADEDAQKKGTVDVMYFVDMQGIPDDMLKYVRDSHHILSAMPCRPCGFHICYNNEFVRPFVSFLHMVTSKDRKLRERLHFGSHLEVQYALCTFGIDLRRENFGNAYIEKFLKVQRQNENEEKRKQQEEEARTGIIMHPSEIDVLCGRGRPYQDFPGNLQVGRIVDQHVPQYLETHERLAKTMIAIGIVKSVRNYGGRFLTRTEVGWELATDKVARGKISQALRVRALKKVRGESLEPEPLSFKPEPETVPSREVKRRRCSSEEEAVEDQEGDLFDDDDFDTTFEELSMV